MKTDAMLPAEIYDLVKYKREVSAHRAEMEKEEKELIEKIKNTMKQASIRQGSIGEYLCSLTLIEKETLDKDKIPENIKMVALKKSLYEKLSIKQIKI